jgi:hypothetical protein
MAAIHKNTTIVELLSDHDEVTHHDEAIRAFVKPILQRNVYLGHVHGMLGTATLTTSPAAGVDEIVAVPPTMPPPCGLWATVMAKVGQGTQGSSPVYTVFRDRLATWIAP